MHDYLSLKMRKSLDLTYKKIMKGESGLLNEKSMMYMMYVPATQLTHSY